MQIKQTLLKTRVYVDGYNLYYGCLKNSPYKWLDLLSLFEKKILPSIMLPVADDSGGTFRMVLDQECSVKFFTAPILGNVAKSKDSIATQQTYHAALKAYSKNRVQFVQGYYDLSKMRVKLVDKDNPKLSPKDCQEATVWKLEEKQSDVNLALHAYHDASQGAAEQIVIVSNDTDIAPAVEMIRKYTAVKIGIVIPTKNAERLPNQALTAFAHWVRKHITEEELKQSQLPRVILGSKKPIVKPHSWYARPDLLDQAIELLLPIKSNRAKAFQWLQTSHEIFGGSEPIDLLDSDVDAERVFEYLLKHQNESYETGK